jgi:hypothetical protein
MTEKGFFELYPSLRPALPAGAYQLAVDHELTASPPEGTGDLAVDGSDFFFSIISPLYAMPPDQILSTFPPASAVGDWHQRLPQIVFKRRTLPWERNPDHTQAFATAPPWLALVVLAEGEGILSGDVPIAQCVTPGTVIDTDADTGTGRYLEVRESIVNTIFPTVEDLNLLAHVRKVNLEDTELALGDDDGYLSVVVANRLPQPGPSVVPNGPATSKRYTAFLVNVQGQMGNLPKHEVSEIDFTFVLDMPELLHTELFEAAPSGPIDVLLMKGLESAKSLSHAVGPGAIAGHSRSATSRGLETAAAGYAIGPTPATSTTTAESLLLSKWQSGVGLSELAEIAPLKFIELEKTFRFPVLVSWDFVCSGDGTFEQLMHGLDSAMLATEDPHLDPALKPEISPTGHIGLAAKTRRGEDTAVWYRGPLVPQPTLRDVPPVGEPLPVAHAADQLRVVVPDGREDVSRASAFEIGRLLALSKTTLVADLMAWRRELFGAARVQQFSIEFLDAVVAGFSDAAVLGKRSLESLIASKVMPLYAERAPSIPAAAFPAAKLPQVLEHFDADRVLVGMGLVPQEVRAATKLEGLQGLSGLSVASTAFSDKPVSSQPEALASVRAGLDRHLDRLVVEALHLDGPAIGAGPGAAGASGKATKSASKSKGPAARRRAPDALDRLLARADRTQDAEVDS